MKIQFTEPRELPDGRIVKAGDTLESPKDGSDELLQAYVSNGVAVAADSVERSATSKKPDPKP